jgi:hypothetical protein
VSTNCRLGRRLQQFANVGAERAGNQHDIIDFDAQRKSALSSPFSDARKLGIMRQQVNLS